MTVAFVVIMMSVDNSICRSLCVFDRMCDRFHGDELVQAPGEIVDAGEEFILINALAGVVHDKYVSNVDLLIAFESLAGDGGAEDSEKQKDSPVCG